MWRGKPQRSSNPDRAFTLFATVSTAHALEPGDIVLVDTDADEILLIDPSTGASQVLSSGGLPLLWCRSGRTGRRSLTYRKKLDFRERC
jgi:hypothetical protein